MALSIPADVLVVPPTAKYEIHVSDVRTYKSCRRKWDWASPLRQHLEPDFTPIHFTIGRGVHYALATYYETGEHPADVFRAWMTAAIAQCEADLGQLWESEREKVDSALLLGTGMLDNYYRWVHSLEEPDARWKVIDTEPDFGPLPILNPSGKPSSRIYLKGRFDKILEETNTGELWLREYKTAGRVPNEKWLELDDQVTIYLWAAQQIIGRPVAGVHFRFLMKNIPEKPRRIYGGKSLSRAINSQLSTTYELYREAIEDFAYDMTAEKVGAPAAQVRTIVDASANTAIEDIYKGFLAELMAEYNDTLDQLAGRGYGDFFKEYEVPKTQHEIEAAAHELWLVGLEMVRPTTPIYTAADWLKCQFCQFRTPCIVRNAGGNFETILKHEYRERRYEDPLESQDKIGWGGA